MSDGDVLVMQLKTMGCFLTVQLGSDVYLRMSDVRFYKRVWVKVENGGFLNIDTMEDVDKLEDLFEASSFNTTGELLEEATEGFMLSFFSPEGLKE